jgi:surface antigen
MALRYKYKYQALTSLRAEHPANTSTARISSIEPNNLPIMKFLTKLLTIISLLAITSYALPTPEAEQSVALERRADDYPYRGSCPGGGVDKWNFFKCQCTSFVAWRINDRLGKKFTNRYKGQHFGNANTWDNAARAAGLKVNKTPKKNSVAMRNANYGHVAWVTKVDGNKVTVEEYNWAKSEDYGKRTVSKGSFDYYIHF